MSANMACRDIVELVSDYLEGALTGGLLADVEAHLAACGGCAMVLDQLRETIRLTGMLTPDALTDRQRAVLLDAFRAFPGG